MAIATDAPRRTPRSSQRSSSRGSRDGAGTTQQIAAPDTATDELVPRFLNLLIPAVTTAVGVLAPKVGPQVGGAIGGLLGGKGAAQAGSQIGGQVGGILGGLFGGREFEADVEVSRALEQYQLTQVVTQIVQRSTPSIIEAMQQQVQDQASRGGSGELDDEALERGWGFLASVIADQVIKHAPGAIKAATHALGSMIGSRDIDDLEPLLVDTETMQRFVAPSISALLAGVQTCMPQLYTLLTTKRETPRDTGISWQDLETTKRLWDNDNITVLPLTPIDNSNEIEIAIELAPHKTWWKGIQVLDDNGSFVTEVGVQDRTKIASVRVPARQLLSPGGYLVFGKAKLFGVHTWMYRLATGGLDQLAGQRAHFYWYAD